MCGDDCFLFSPPDPSVVCCLCGLLHHLFELFCCGITPKSPVHTSVMCPQYVGDDSGEHGLLKTGLKWVLFCL